ncbi:Protein translocase subunit SecY [Bombilactobacillus mellis]|uniref:Protein translocase subunit SecY n=1 Tax=Bombilactobacillus mellis TaxID=1218508 RepID=A0A0F4KZ82_9LACO|nr:preprotein translocase subunit SecY [Bombilactobacillus mellis]MBI0106758.1 preprotein translocase subunit SecY [Lactobacillus sp. W8086]MBI0108222.1 preprotein translocase subunit SecY [Lactobacillus sp. W8085]MBI0111440.1 preprotein translocase subunit SecY [Lactobacillus sp. W8088]MBI0115155.1 preprotein translocase subunit SecY [Lactobacillus sp. W8087]MBI0118880.1 preprotein translocase subunit SecY [Lactobacillus sp. W8089]MBI0130845.1 preprotein translocase subunit SecY [Lactobacill
MLGTLRNALKVKEIRKKIFFTLFILAIYRLGAQIAVPGINISAMEKLSSTGLIPLLDTVSGGGLANYSIFSMGVSPYITAQIVIQLLQTDIVPKFVEWSKQGEVGRRKLNQVTRYLTIVLAFVQSIGITAGFNALSGMGLVSKPSVQTFITLGIIMTGGSMLLTWMGEQITDKGIGNGVSMIIFAGIVARLPQGLYQLIREQVVSAKGNEIWLNILFIVIILVLVLLVTQFTTYVQQANRKVPIQYTRRATSGGSESYLPLKVNVAGVIPVIFASSLIVTPATILTAFQKSHAGDTWFQVLQNVFSLQTTTGALVYTALIVLFTFFYAFVQVNPEKLAENLQKQGAYIPGIWPGNETIKYVSGLLLRLSTVGSVFLGLIALLPQLATNIFGLPQSIGLGGTSLLIVVGVAIEANRQLEGLLMKREYVGFIR